MKDDLIYAIVRGVLVGALVFVLIEQNNKIEELEYRVQAVEHDNAVVLNSCKTVGQMVLEQGARWNGAEK